MMASSNPFLPAECIAEILDWLRPNCWVEILYARRVSKHWQSAVAWMVETELSRNHDLCQDSFWRPTGPDSRWHRLALLSMPLMTSTFLEGLHGIDFSQSIGVSNLDMTLVALQFPNLQTLILRGTTRVTDSGFLSVATQCGALREVDVSECRSRITDESFRQLAYKSTLLEDVNIHGTNGAITNTSICLLARNNLNLRSLNVGSTWGKVSDSSCYELARFSAQLSVLDVSDTRGAISDDGLIAVANGCPNLHSLSVGGTGGKVTDRLFEVLADLHRNMKLIDVSDTSGNVTNKGLTALLPWCTNLKVFRARNISNNSIGRATLTALGKSCPLLEELDTFQLAEHCTTIESTGLTAVAVGCRKLRVVDLTRCLNIDMGLHALCHHGTELSKLTLRSAPFTTIQEMSLSPLEQKSKLTVLSLHGCCRVSGFIARLLKKHRQLTALQLQGDCRADSTSVLQQIAEVGSDSLLYLDITGLGFDPSPKFSSFYNAALSLKSLNRLVLPKLKELEPLVIAIQQAFPQIQIDRA
jgi:hypothetical protein